MDSHQTKPRLLSGSSARLSLTNQKQGNNKYSLASANQNRVVNNTQQEKATTKRAKINYFLLLQLSQTKTMKVLNNRFSAIDILKNSKTRNALLTDFESNKCDNLSSQPSLRKGKVLISLV